MSLLVISAMESTTWGIIGGVVAAFVGYLGKVTELKLFRDKSNARLQADLLQRIGKLEGKLENQEKKLDIQAEVIQEERGRVRRLRRKVRRLEGEVNLEKTFKQNYYDELQTAVFWLELYRRSAGQRLEGDDLEWAARLDTLRAKHGEHPASVPEAGPESPNGSNPTPEDQAS